MGAWMDIGISAANAGVNTGLGMLSQLVSSRLNEKAAQRADLRGRQLYHDLQSPAAQVAQLKQAGLSPALLYAKVELEEVQAQARKQHQQRTKSATCLT